MRHDVLLALNFSCYTLAMRSNINCVLIRIAFSMLIWLTYCVKLWATKSELNLSPNGTFSLYNEELSVHFFACELSFHPFLLPGLFINLNCAYFLFLPSFSLISVQLPQCLQLPMVSPRESSPFVVSADNMLNKLLKFHFWEEDCSLHHGKWEHSHLTGKYNMVKKKIDKYLFDVLLS